MLDTKKAISISYSQTKIHTVFQTSQKHFAIVCRTTLQIIVSITALQTSDPAWYGMITSQLTPEQNKQLEEVFKLADQRKAVAGMECCGVGCSTCIKIIEYSFCGIQ